MTTESMQVESSIKKSQTRLSFIITARNDNYGGNSNWRLETTLNYLAENLKKLDRLDEVEVIITDWGSEIPLDSVLSLNPAARLITRFLLVPPSLAVDLQGDSKFPDVLAGNAAVRRSRGYFVAVIYADILLTQEYLDCLFRVIDGSVDIGAPIERSLLMSRRRNVPSVYVNRCPNLQELDWVVCHFGSLMPFDLPLRIHHLPFHYYFPASLFMMSRWLWDDCRGVDESMMHYGFIDTDLVRRVASKYTSLYMDVNGLTLFHLDHYRSATGPITDRKINQDIFNNKYCPNGDAWGLGNHAIEEASCSGNSGDKYYPALDVEQRVPLTFGLIQIVTSIVASWLISRIALWPRRTWLVLCDLRRQPVRLWLSTLLRLLSEWRLRRRMRRPNATCETNDEESGS